MLRITICPSCGSRKIKKVRRNWTDDFEGHRYKVPNLKFWQCPDCGEKIYDREAMRRIEANCPAYAKGGAVR